MSIKVDVPDANATVEFPDDFTEEQISSEINKSFFSKKTEPPAVDFDFLASEGDLPGPAIAKPKIGIESDVPVTEATLISKPGSQIITPEARHEAAVLTDVAGKMADFTKTQVQKAVLEKPKNMPREKWDSLNSGFISSFSRGIMESLLRAPEELKTTPETFSEKSGKFLGSSFEQIGELMSLRGVFAPGKMAFFKALSAKSGIDRLLSDGNIESDVANYFTQDIPRAALTAGVFHFADLTALPFTQTTLNVAKPLARAIFSIQKTKGGPGVVKATELALKSLGFAYKGMLAGGAQFAGLKAIGVPTGAAAKESLAVGMFAAIQGPKVKSVKKQTTALSRKIPQPPSLKRFLPAISDAAKTAKTFDGFVEKVKSDSILGPKGRGRATSILKNEGFKSLADFYEKTQVEPELRKAIVEPPTLESGPEKVDLEPIETNKMAIEDEPIDVPSKLSRVFTRFKGLDSITRQTFIKFEERQKEIPKIAANRVVRIYRNIDEKGQRKIVDSIEHPSRKISLTESELSAKAELLKDQSLAKEMLNDLGYTADWPNNRVVYLKSKIRELKKIAYKTEKAETKRKQRIVDMKEEIKNIKNVGYVHRITKKPNVINKITSFIVRPISKKPRGLFGRKFATAEEAERKGFKVASLSESHADLLHKIWQAQLNLDLISAVNSNKELSLPTKKAPPDWVGIDRRIYPSGANRKYQPMIAEAIEEIAGVSYGNNPANILVRAYDNVNAVLKYIGFYNPFVMTKNDLFQGWRLGGVKFLKEIPEATKIKSEAGVQYNNLREAGLFNNVISYTPAADALVKDMLDRIHKTKGKRFAEIASKGLNPVNLVKDITSGFIKLNNFTTWNLDEVMRIAAYNSIRDGRLSKSYGMSDFELIETANDFMANYGKVPKATRKVLNRFIFTPTYKISMARVLGRMWQAPEKFWPMLARHYAYKMFVWYMLPGIIGLYVAGNWGAARGEKGYRIVLHIPGEKKERVYSLSDPLLEEAKLTQRALLWSVELNLAALPNMMLNMMRGPRFKNKRDLLAPLFKLGTPFWREFLIMTDEDKSRAEKIISLLAIAFVYDRKKQKTKGDEEISARNIARAISLWSDWSEQRKDISRKFGVRKRKKSSNK